MCVIKILTHTAYFYIIRKKLLFIAFLLFRLFFATFFTIFFAFLFVFVTIFLIVTAFLSAISTTTSIVVSTTMLIVKSVTFSARSFGLLNIAKQLSLNGAVGAEVLKLLGSQYFF